MQQLMQSLLQVVQLSPLAILLVILVLAS